MTSPCTDVVGAGGTATPAGAHNQAAAVQELRRAAAIAAAWLTPGDYPPKVVEGITIPKVDLDAREVATVLRTALRDTEAAS